MNVAKKVGQCLSKKGTDSYWSYKDFSDLPPMVVAKVLSRMCKKGILIRVCKGIYYYPKSTALGSSVPNTDRAVDKVINSQPLQNVQIFSGGGASFYNLGLSTQVPAQYCLLSDSNRKKINVYGTVIKVIPRSSQCLKGAKQQDVWLLDAIRHLKHVPDSTPAKALAGVIQILKDNPGALKRLVKFAPGEPPRSRALIGAIAEYLGVKKTLFKKIKSTLNPLSRYKLDIGDGLPNSSAWGIAV